jgi:hypothetical protein
MVLANRFGEMQLIELAVFLNLSWFNFAIERTFRYLKIGCFLGVAALSAFHIYYLGGNACLTSFTILPDGGF